MTFLVYRIITRAGTAILVIHRSMVDSGPGRKGSGLMKRGCFWRGDNAAICRLRTSDDKSFRFKFADFN